MKILTKQEKELIKENILGIRETSLSSKLEYEKDAIYMAMCLLLPKNSFLRKVEELGGLEIVIADYEAQKELADIFRVEVELINLRIRELYIEKLKEKNLTSKINEISSEEIDLEKIKHDALTSVSQYQKEAEAKLKKKLM